MHSRNEILTSVKFQLRRWTWRHRRPSATGDLAPAEERTVLSRMDGPVENGRSCREWTPRTPTRDSILDQRVHSRRCSSSATVPTAYAVRPARSVRASALVPQSEAFIDELISPHKASLPIPPRRTASCRARRRSHPRRAVPRASRSPQCRRRA